MTFHADLSSYRVNERQCLNSVLNVGWLSQAWTFPKGSTDPKLIKKLTAWCRKPIFLCMGFHICEYCGMKSPADGNGEIWITSGREMVFRMPTMVRHYIEEHGYKLPESAERDLSDAASHPLTDEEALSLCKSKASAAPYYMTVAKWKESRFDGLIEFGKRMGKSRIHVDQSWVKDGCICVAISNNDLKYCVEHLDLLGDLAPDEITIVLRRDA